MIGQPSGGRRRARRHGTTIAELVVALTISAVVAAMAAGAMLGVERQLRRGRGESDAARLEQEVELLLRSELRGAGRDSVIVRGDTAVELFVHVGSAVVCGVAGRVVIAPPSQVASGVPLSRWRYTPSAGDLLYVYDTLTSSWTRAVVDSAASRVDAAACPPATGFNTKTDSAARRSIIRFVLSAAPSAAQIGAPIRVVRRGRWGLVRGTDRSWELVWRVCDAPGSCQSSQPAVGPLATPTDSGLRFLPDSSGAVTVLVRAATSRGLGRALSSFVVSPMSQRLP